MHPLLHTGLLGRVDWWYDGWRGCFELHVIGQASSAQLGLKESHGGSSGT